MWVLCTVHSTHSVQCALHSRHSTQGTQCTVCIVHSTHTVHSVHRVHSALGTQYTVCTSQKINTGPAPGFNINCHRYTTDTHSTDTLIHNWYTINCHWCTSSTASQWRNAVTICQCNHLSSWTLFVHIHNIFPELWQTNSKVLLPKPESRLTHSRYQWSKNS